MANISEQVAKLSSPTQAKVVKQGEILLENGVEHVVIRAGANEVAATKTPVMETQKPAQQLS